MSRKIGFTTPFGGIEYQWEKDIKNISEKDFAKDVLDSFLIAIKAGDDVSLDEITRFLEALRNYGHLAKFDGKTQKKYQELLTIKKERDNESKKDLDVYLGAWKSVHEFSLGTQPSYQIILNIFISDSGTLTCKGNLSFEETGSSQHRYLNELMEDFLITRSKSGLHLAGISVELTRHGTLSFNNQYIFDIFFLEYIKETGMLQGKHVRPEGQIEAKFEKI